ncbi:11064_t:CDS:2 [Diversispora eburnea]|uniref:11064_t:CDS:1 n=1 Tax=Diversispora eburnea TaxID=1213867 RepID=A0A9N9ASH3_9GLOM|nr:11064_t:CDS:2 [Diversispora eburnea]
MSTENTSRHRYNLPDLCIRNILNFINDDKIDRNWCYISTPFLWSNPFTIVKNYVENEKNRKFEIIILDEEEIDQCSQDDNNQDKIKDTLVTKSEKDIKDINTQETKSIDNNNFRPHIIFQKLITSYVQSLPDDTLSSLELNTPIENFHRNPLFNYSSFIRHLPMSQIFIAVLTFCVQSKYSFYNSPISFDNTPLPLCYHSRDPIRRNAHVVICAKPTLLLTHLMNLFISNSPKIFSLELIGSLKPLSSLASNLKYPHFLDLSDLNIFTFPNSSICFKHLKNFQCFDNIITNVIIPLSLNKLSTNIEEFAIKGSHADDIQSYHLSSIAELAKVISIQQNLKVLSIDNINCATIVCDVNCMKTLLEEGLSNPLGNSKVLETLTKIEFTRITFRSDRYSPINILAKCKNLQHLIIKSCTNLRFSSSDEKLANVLIPMNLLAFFTRCFKNTLRSLVVWLKTFRNYTDIVLWIIEFNQLEFIHIYLTPQKINNLNNLCVILEDCQDLKEVIIEDRKYFEKVPEVFRLLNYGTIDANDFLCKIVMMLTFKINFSFTPGTLEFFISNAVSLKYLSFEYSASLTDEHLLILQELSNKTNIKTLNIGYTPNIDEEVINLAKEIIPEIIYWK